GFVEIKLRSALFTASLVGNAFATSGSSRTIIDDLLKRFAYFPRTSSPRSERLYSARPQSFSSDLAFFINFGFALRCTSPDVAAVNGLRIDQRKLNQFSRPDCA